MCTITKDGYLMKDGTTIPFKQLKFGDIAPHHVEEMNVSTASVWDVVLLRNSVFEIKDDIENMLSAQTKEIKGMLGTHAGECPINRDEVNKLIDERLNTRTEIKIKKGSKILEFVWKGMLAILVVLNLVFLLLGKSPIQITP